MSCYDEGMMHVVVDGRKQLREIDHVRREDWRMVLVPVLRSNERFMTTIGGETIIYKVSDE